MGQGFHLTVFLPWWRMRSRPLEADILQPISTRANMYFTLKIFKRIIRMRIIRATVNFTQCLVNNALTLCKLYVAKALSLSA